MLEELKEPISSLRKDIQGVWEKLDPESIERKIKETEAKTLAEGFWNDTEKAQKVMNDLKLLKGRIEPWRDLISQADDISTLYELAIEDGDGDGSLEAEVRTNLEAAQ